MVDSNSSDIIACTALRYKILWCLSLILNELQMTIIDDGIETWMLYGTLQY